jgi:RsiW-degrading membrane proteinase PrsW (M82 family)
MSFSAAAWLVIAFAVVAANLPFANERLFVVGPRRAPKSLAWRLLELALLYGATLGVGFALESRLGQYRPQGWEFYVALGALFLTLAFPGFVWRYLRRRA